MDLSSVRNSNHKLNFNVGQSTAILLFVRDVEYSHHGILHVTILPFCMTDSDKTTKESLDRKFIEHAKTCSLGDDNFSRVFFAVPLPSVPWSLLHLCHLSSFLPNQFSVPFICTFYYHSTYPSSAPFTKAISILNNADYAI